MKKVDRSIACAMFLITALSVPALTFAQSPFDGTWRINMNQSKISPKPIGFYLSQGWYHCTTCVPTYDVQADGQDHAVTGQTFDTISVKEVDANTIQIMTKKDGKADSESTRAVSAKGKTLTVKETSHPESGAAPITTEVTASRVGPAPGGTQATSGNWKIEKIKQSDNGLTFTYKTAGDELTMSDPTGATYTAKLDGTDAPVKGAYGYDTVSVKKINAHSLEETDKQGSDVVDVSTMTLSPDGKKMTIVDNNKKYGRTSTFVATKQ
jgi:hypothetical protein